MRLPTTLLILVKLLNILLVRIVKNTEIVLNYASRGPLVATHYSQSCVCTMVRAQFYCAILLSAGKCNPDADAFASYISSHNVMVTSLRHVLPDLLTSLPACVVAMAPAVGPKGSISTS